MSSSSGAIATGSDDSFVISLARDGSEGRPVDASAIWAPGSTAREPSGAQKEARYADRGRFLRIGSAPSTVNSQARAVVSTLFNLPRLPALRVP